MNFRQISAWSIRNPVVPLVLFAGLLFAGMLSFNRMSVNGDPDIDFPAAIISIAQPGAAPSEMETQVTLLVEAAVRGVNGIEEINSSVREGSSSTFVQFAIGTPIDRAVNDVRDAITNIRGDLPDGILEPQVSRLDINDEPLAFYSAESTSMTLEELSWYVDNTVSKRLRSISGVGSVTRDGGVSREIRVDLDPARMQAIGVTASQINQQLRSLNLNAAGGRAEIGGTEQSVRVLGNALNAHALGQTNISLGGGRTIRLSDVASVSDSAAEQRSLAMMGGRQVLSFGISRAKGASDVSVYDAVQVELDALREANPDVRYTELFTSVNYTKDNYKSAMRAMVEGAVLAVIVVFLFLRDWRATLISAIAIPLSAVPAFWFMSMLGFSLNVLSLLALSLVAGVLVDDAIVEIENIVRHMRMGKSAYQASIDAADEIGLAVLATTMSIVSVFLPVGLMPGISGQFFKNFGLTVVAAVLVSLAVARMITPMLAAYFLKSHGAARHGDAKWIGWYITALTWTLRNRWKTMGLGLVSFVLTIIAFAGFSLISLPGIPLTFIPPQDNDFSQIRINLTPGATLEQTQAITSSVSEMISRDRDVKSAFSDINVGNANIFMTLKADRSRSSIDFERSWAPRLARMADARVGFQSQNDGGPGSSGRDITITLSGDNSELLNATAARIVAEMQGLPELVAPRTNADLRRPEIIIRPRTQLATELGVSTAALSQAIRIATLGEIEQNSAKFSLNDRQVPINVQMGQTSRTNLAAIENLPVATSNGGSVPLKLVADISFGSGPVVIQRSNQTRRVSLGADLAPGLVSGDAMPKIRALPTMAHLPDGVTELQLGQSKWQAELLFSFVIALLTGILLVFATLVLLYKRLLPPLVNMGSLLLAPLGAAMALRITGDAVSMPVLIGILLLLGIVAKNSILLVDFALVEMGKDIDKFSAIIDAGHKRAQPIVMTTVAMVAGMIPVALSLDGDGSFRAPMGVTVIGGLIISTLLTLLIVPAAFSLAVGAEHRIGPWLRRKLLSYRPGDDGSSIAVQPAE